MPDSDVSPDPSPEARALAAMEGARRDLLHGNAIEPALSECLAPHSDQLISALGCCHSPSSHAT